MSAPKPQIQEVKSTNDTAPWAPQQPHLKHGFEEARNIYDQGPQQFFGGQTYANPDAATTAGLNATEARANAGSPLLGQAQGEMSKILSGQYLDPNSNPGFSSMLDSVRANVLPGIDSRFISAGRSGSGLHGRAVGEGLGSAIGQLTYGNYNDERNRMTGAMNAAPGMAMADYADPQMLGQVGAQREGQAQQGINEAIARHDYGQMAPNQALAQYMQMISGNYGGQSTGTTQQLIPQTNPWTTALGGLFGAAGAVGGLQPWKWSDERLKEDIKRIGETDDGLGVYTYRYKGDGAMQMGVLAQEVAAVNPAAVGVHSSGFLAVDYGAL